jgi:pSer/pThr/pTyr-binding forkhead associated (FHA) protein
MAGFDSTDEVILRVIGGPNNEKRIRVPDEGLELGRGVDGPGLLIGDHYMSGRHAELWWDDQGGLQLQALQSTAATLLNGTQITGRASIEPGDELTIGSTTMVVLVSRPKVAGAGRPAPQPAAAPPMAPPSQSVDQQAYGQGVNVGGANYGIVDTSKKTTKVKVESPYTRWERMRGPAKFVMFLGLLVAFAGFAVFGYPILAAGTDMASGDQARNACIARFPELGFEQTDCIIKAAQQSDANRPDRSQFTNLGAGLFFVGLVLTTFAYFLPGADPKKKRKST